jgi:uncharacterized protein YsxB (DUF464 family)
MLDVTFYRDGRNRPSSLLARGHAAFAEYGQDVVCAAVSAILQATRLGLERVAAVPLEVSQASGELRLSWPQESRDLEAVRAIVETAELSVRQIASQYPAHVRCELRREETA